MVPSPSSPLLCPWGGPADSSCHLNGRHRLQATEHSHGHLLSSGLRLPVRRLRPPLSRPKLKPRKTEDVRYRCPSGGHSPRAGSTFNTTYWPGAGGFPCCWGRLPTPVRCPASLASFFFELQCRVGPPTGRGVVEVDWGGGQSAPGDPAPGSPLAARTLREVLRRHTRTKPVPPAGGPGRRRAEAAPAGLCIYCTILFIVILVALFPLSKTVCCEAGRPATPRVASCTSRCPGLSTAPCALALGESRGVLGSHALSGPVVAQEQRTRAGVLGVTRPPAGRARGHAAVCPRHG